MIETKPCKQGENWEGEPNQVAVAYCDTHRCPLLECKLRALEAENRDLKEKMNTRYWEGIRTENASLGLRLDQAEARVHELETLCKELRMRAMERWRKNAKLREARP